jgi:hypothetical protein
MALVKVSRPIHRNDRGRAMRQLQNNPAWARVVLDEHEHMLGGMVHLEGDRESSGLLRAS